MVWSSRWPSAGVQTVRPTPEYRRSRQQTCSWQPSWRWREAALFPFLFPFLSPFLSPFLLSGPLPWLLDRRAFPGYRALATWPESPPGSAGATCKAPRFQLILPNRAAALRPGFLAWYARSTRVPWPEPGFLLAEASREWISPTAHGPVLASRPGKSAGLSRHP